MCRNIRMLYNFDPPATDLEIHEAALQYVRKVSGYRTPSAVNEPAFAAAVADVAAATAALIYGMVTHAHHRDRAEEAEKARERGAKRFGGIVNA